MSGLEQADQEANFAVQLTPAEVTIFPMSEGRPMTPEEYQALDQEAKSKIDDLRADLMQQTQETMFKVREIEKESLEKIQDLERSAASNLVSVLLRDAYALSQDLPEMRDYLNGLSEYILDHLNLFKEPDLLRPGQTGPGQPPIGWPGTGAQSLPSLRDKRSRR